jgi:hypothetical protein
MVEDKPQSAKILEETAEVVAEKESDYSHSWETVGVLKRVMSSPNEPQVIELTPKTEVVVLHDTPQKTSTFEENADGIITRLLDKVVRSWNLIFMKDEPDVENDSTEDAAVDIAGYGASVGKPYTT